MKFGTEVHWTNTIDLSRGPTKKDHFPTCYDVIFLEILEISKSSKKRIKWADMGINRTEIKLVNKFDGFCGEKIEFRLPGS